MTAVASGIAAATRDGSRTTLTAADLDVLRAGVDGDVLLPDDPGWDDAVTIWNAMAATTPAVVVRPASAQGVAAAVGFARDQGLLLTVKGGGHHIAGTALAPGALTVDLSRLDRVEVDPAARLASVGGGCRLRDVDRATQEVGLATVLGFISDTGVAGLTLGGGFGYLTRRFGWGVDNLDSVEVVTADGAIRTASRTENSELFWGIRGAGANLGVVTRFTFRLHEVGPTVFGGLIAWPFERADEVLSTYRTMTAAAPAELTAFLIVLNAPAAPFVPPDWHGRPVSAMALCFSGDLDATEDVVAPVRDLGTPVFDLLGEQPYVQLQSYLDDTEPVGHHYYWKTEFLAELDEDLLRTLPELFRDCPVPGAQIGVLHLGGALNTRPDDDGAVGNRGVRFAIGVNGGWPPGEPAEEQYRDWIRAAWQRVRPFSTGATYINFQTADEGDERVRATYGSHYARLRRLKQAYDPGNLFRVNRNIAPAGAPEHARHEPGPVGPEPRV